MKKSFRSYLILSLTLVLFAGCGTALSGPSRTGSPEQTESAVWKEIGPGLSLGQLHLKTGESGIFNDLLTVVIDPKKYSFSVVENKDKDSAKTIREIHEETGSLLTFNGSFFTEEFKPTGLLISEGKKLHATSPADLMNGIFAVNDEGGVKLFANNAYLNEKKYIFAIQNGPVLLDEKGNIKIGKDTGKTASRTAIGLDSNGDIVLVIVKQSLLNADNSISLYEFAHLLKESPEFAKLGLRATLNLDGGPSTGMMIGDQYYPELAKVQNVVTVKPRST